MSEAVHAETGTEITSVQLDAQKQIWFGGGLFAVSVVAYISSALNHPSPQFTFFMLFGSLALASGIYNTVVGAIDYAHSKKG